MSPKVLMVAGVALAGSIAAQAQALSPELAQIGFLVGDWVAAPGNASPDRGHASIHPIVGGAALMRNDHHEVVDPRTGKVTASFDQVMPIYAEGGTLRGDYLDGTHVIHYTHARVEPGRSVEFLTADDARPAYRLTYTKDGAGELGIRFEIGGSSAGPFQVIADAKVRRE
ncbi:MAG TPA: hypothetical protein VKT30_14350 [Caulobacteraceae bacterium]|nr:hypothetical protein [Caulobacteraceae bacterium]